jgi:hypothetical protein
MLGCPLLQVDPLPFLLYKERNPLLSLHTILSTCWPLPLSLSLSLVEFSTYAERLHHSHRSCYALDGGTLSDWITVRVDTGGGIDLSILGSRRIKSSRLGGIHLAMGIAAFRIFTEPSALAW